MTYHADISETALGRFSVRLRGTDIWLQTADPEHALCHAMVKARLPDGPIQFWRDGGATLSHSSVHRMAKMRIEIGERFPRRVNRRNGFAGTIGP